MKKTPEEIEGDVYRLINSSPIKKAIKGKVYRKDLRPDNATTEDVVVIFSSGVNSQIQSGTVEVNVYVPDISIPGYSSKKKNEPRVKELGNIINEWIEQVDSIEYEFDVLVTPTAIGIEGIEQHLISVLLEFKRITI